MSRKKKQRRSLTRYELDACNAALQIVEIQTDTIKKILARIRRKKKTVKNGSFQPSP